MATLVAAKCKNCMYFDQDKGNETEVKHKFGRCVRFPPQFAVTNDPRTKGLHEHNKFPVIEEDRWCGEFLTRGGFLSNVRERLIP